MVPHCAQLLAFAVILTLMLIIQVIFILVLVRVIRTSSSHREHKRCCIEDSPKAKRPVRWTALNQQCFGIIIPVIRKAKLRHATSRPSNTVVTSKTQERLQKFAEKAGTEHGWVCDVQAEGTQSDYHIILKKVLILIIISSRPFQNKS